MGFKKHGEGQVSGTEGLITKTASPSGWTIEDAAALDRENALADEAAEAARPDITDIFDSTDHTEGETQD